MAKKDKIITLFHLHTGGFDTHFYAFVIQVATWAARNVCSNFAQELLRDPDDKVKVTSKENESSREPRPISRVSTSLLIRNTNA